MNAFQRWDGWDFWVVHVLSQTHTYTNIYSRVNIYTLLRVNFGAGRGLLLPKLTGFDIFVHFCVHVWMTHLSVGVLCLDLLPEFFFYFLTFSLFIYNSCPLKFIIHFQTSRIKDMLFFLIPIQLQSSFLPLFSSAALSDNDLESKLSQRARQTVMRAGILIISMRGFFQVITLNTLDRKPFVTWVSVNAGRWQHHH